MELKKKKLPGFFKPLFWEVDFSSVSPQKHKRRIIVKTINRGRWEHWVWIINYYGKEQLKEAITNIPVSEFREPALNLISLILGIEQMKYVSRSDYITSQKSIGKS